MKTRNPWSVITLGQDSRILQALTKLGPYLLYKSSPADSPSSPNPSPPCSDCVACVLFRWSQSKEDTGRAYSTGSLARTTLSDEKPAEKLLGHIGTIWGPTHSYRQRFTKTTANVGLA